MIKTKSKIKCNTGLATAVQSETTKDIKHETTNSKVSVIQTIFAGSKSEPAFSPSDFEDFVPWVCKQWSDSTEILITGKMQGIFFHTIN